MRVLSGIQPTGQFHLGNYLGALKHWVRLQDEGNECFYPIVDLHALTTVHDAKAFKKNVEESQLAMLAIGFDPSKSVLFLQSRVFQHTELAWIFETITSIGDLQRMTQYKDKSAQVGKGGLNVGLLTYPTLMAADILLYNPEYVPVGEDQIQHLELARSIARKFNNTYGEVFREPKAIIQKESARILSLQDPGKKMSKSLGSQHYVGLFEDEKSIRAKIKRAVTDSGSDIKYDPKNKPAISNLLSIYSGITDKPIKELEKDFSGKGYAEFKSSLADELVKHLRPIQKHYADLSKNASGAHVAFADGAKKAAKEAESTMQKVRELIGLR